MMKIGGIRSLLKPHDLLASFLACAMHDFEHPGYSNSFVIRTKHPLAIRYSDYSVLENHHLAAAFAIMFDPNKNCNLLNNLNLDMQGEARKTIIQAILSTDMSKHFTILTELKTKLGNNFPNKDSFEDRNLIVSVSLKIANQFKVVRERGNFFKWMENMFEEFFKQGEIEKQLELPISKFMDKETTNKEKAYANYLTVVSRPLFVTYMILVNDAEVSESVFKNGIDDNKKRLETRIEESGSK